MHTFRSNVLGMITHKNGLIVTTERGVYWFASINSKPRKIKT